MKFFFKYPRLALIVFFATSSALIWYQVAHFSGSGRLTVAMLDIGQGDAIFIETPSGNQILVDGGPGSKVLQELARHMSFFDDSIDMLVVTNPDRDHIGGFIDVLKKFEVSAVIEPGTMPDTSTYKQFEKLAASAGVKKIIAQRGMDIVLDTDVHLLILFPDRDVSGMTTNDGSIVAKLVYKNTSIMLTGDAPEKTETYLVGLNAPILDSDILKVGHHGSKTSTSDAFVAAVSPRYALISAGKNNSYGHPAQIVLDRLAAHGVETHGTYKEGTIVFESDGDMWKRE